MAKTKFLEFKFNKTVRDNQSDYNFRLGGHLIYLESKKIKIFRINCLKEFGSCGGCQQNYMCKVIRGHKEVSKR